MHPANSRSAFAKTEEQALEDLLAIQMGLIRFGESLPEKSDAALNRRPGAGKWSALECLEHLNRYADHYLPRLEARTASAKIRSNPDAPYRPGLLGKPFARTMHVSGRTKPVRSPGNMNPLGSPLDAGRVVTSFVANQCSYGSVLRALRDKRLDGSRIPVSAFPLVRLRLGDMLYTLVWHNERHVAQASETMG